MAPSYWECVTLTSFKHWPIIQEIRRLSIATFQIFQKFWQKPNKHQDPDDMTALYILGMAAHYSPNPKSPYLGCDFPFDLETGEIKQDVWNRWISFDPTRMVVRYQENLKKMKLIYIDC